MLRLAKKWKGDFIGLKNKNNKKITNTQTKEKIGHLSVIFVFFFPLPHGHTKLASGSWVNSKPEFKKNLWLPAILAAKSDNLELEKKANRKVSRSYGQTCLPGRARWRGLSFYLSELMIKCRQHERENWSWFCPAAKSNPWSLSYWFGFCLTEHQ